MQKFQAKGGLDTPLVSIANTNETLENGNSIVFSNKAGVTNIIKSTSTEMSIFAGASVVNSFIPGEGIVSNVMQSNKSNSLVRKDYVDGALANIVLASRDSILAETDLRYLKLSGGTVTGDTQFNSKVVIDSASPTVDYRVAGKTKYQTSVVGENYTFGTDAPPSTFSALATPPGATGKVIFDMRSFKNELYTVGVQTLSKSTNGGQSWTNFTLPGMPTNADYLGCFAIDDYLFILGIDKTTGAGARYYSQDGTTWIRMANPAGSRNYDNPILMKKLDMGKYIIVGLGFVSISDSILGTYTRHEWHSNTPAVTRYCHAVSEHGNRIVAHVPDSATGLPRAYVSEDKGVSWSIRAYTGDVPSGQIMGCGQVNNTWYFVDLNGSLYTSLDGVAMTRLIDVPAGKAVRFAASVFDNVSKAIIIGDNTGVVSFTKDFSAWRTFKLSFDIRVIRSIPGKNDSFYVASQVAQFGSVELQYDGAPLAITPQGPVTDRPQQNIPNSLVRRDYVDKLVSEVETKMESRNYLPLSGGTLTDTLTLNVPNSSGFGKYSISMNDGSIGAINSIIFKDSADANEGLFFPKSGRSENTTSPADYDNISALDGHLLLNGQKAYGEWNKPTPVTIGLDMDTIFYARTSSGDLNNDVLPGHYHVNNNATNRPVTDLLFGHMTVSSIGKTGQGNWFQQTFYGHTAPFKIWTRRNINGTYSPWKRIYTEDDPITAAELGISADGLNPDLYYTKNQVYSQDQVNTKFTQFNEKYDANNDGVVDKANVANMVVGIAETGYPSYYGKNMNGEVGFHAFTPRTVDDTLNQQYIIPNAKASVPVKITLESPAPLQNTIIQCYKSMPGIQNINEGLETFNTNNTVKYYIESDNLEFSEVPNSNGASIKTSHQFITSSGPTTGTFISEEITPSSFQMITGIV